MEVFLLKKVDLPSADQLSQQFADEGGTAEKGDLRDLE